MPSSLAADTPADAEAKAAFHLRLRAKGIRDLRVLRALERVPRASFVPARHQALAARDLAVPIECGQTLHESWLVGRMIEALAAEPSHKILEIGAGTGYATAILTQLAEEVVAVERHQSLALAARSRLETLAIANASLVWGDGLDLPDAIGRFDRVIVHGLLEDASDLLCRLMANGCLVCARTVGTSQRITRLTPGAGGVVREDNLGPCSLQPIVPGLAGML